MAFKYEVKTTPHLLYILTYQPHFSIDLSLEYREDKIVWKVPLICGSKTTGQLSTSVPAGELAGKQPSVKNRQPWQH